jgi:hypothetical protein
MREHADAIDEFRHPDQGLKGRVERSFLHDMPLLVEARSLRSALRASVETTEGGRPGWLVDAADLVAHGGISCV